MSKQLIHQEHKFNRHVVRGNITYWRCSQFSACRCRARLKTVDEKLFILNMQHNHEVVRRHRLYGALKELKRKMSSMNDKRTIAKTTAP